ncbi:hypothetical protein PYW08_002275 [Mythimna loreyi]|uniref:Uncharacterized protein n=1 Tax=Mythimna loreyi TaxID=667449 RepID=A0ACC2R3Z2_9NEOP|nr:hypothetical protein PYW08_002275 [Mythimna loreyi]
MHSKQNITQESNNSDDLKLIENDVPLPMKWEILWREVIFVTFMHFGAIYGIYAFLMVAKWQTCLFFLFLHTATTLSITAGVHRLWSHKSYKAKLPLRILLAMFFTMSVQYSGITWVRYHRKHHKYSDTDADPHNPKRGFFYAHIGWLLVRKHPQVKAHFVDISDLKEDPVLRFQHKYYVILVAILALILPAYIPTLWGEEMKIAIYICVCLRFVCSLHMFASVNSVAHKWGTKSYDKHINPADSKIISFIAIGEGFHNYHHTFPWDYRSAELGGYSLNFTKLFIDFMEKIGWAYDLKVVPDELIKKRVKRTGDGSHPVWGWDDPDLSADDKKITEINYNKRNNIDDISALDNISSFLLKQCN